MIPFVFFLLFALVWAGVTYAATTRAMSGPWQRDEPAAVARRLRARNRTVLVATLVAVVLVAAMEILIPAASDAVQDLQYGVGDATGSDLALFTLTGNGSLSWGLYLAILLGTAAGLVGGTVAAVAKYPILRGISRVSI